MSITKLYLAEQLKYEKKYGKENTIVLMQVGSFYEAYSTNDEGFDLTKLSKILNIQLTKKDKSMDVNYGNPNMSGFPAISLNKFLRKLTEHGLTVVVISQTTPPPKPKREVTGIYTAGTFIDTDLSPESNNIMSIYLEEEPQSKKCLVSAGLSVIDLSTGVNTIHEAYSTVADDMFALDETLRFINSYNPREIILTFIRSATNSKLDKNELVKYLELNDKNIQYFDTVAKNIQTIAYQNEFLKRVFPNCGMLSPIEYIDMERMASTRLSYIILLQYAYDHNTTIIDNINQPIIYKSDKYLTLSNSAMFQLNIINNGENSRNKSLFAVVNKTSTSMGMRYLNDCLLNPCMDTALLRNRYDAIAELMNKDLYIEVENYLKNVMDLERLHRRVALGELHPFEFMHMHYSYEHIDKMIKQLYNNPALKFVMIPDASVKQFQKFITEYKFILLLDDLKKYNMNDIENNIFNQGIYPDIDKLQTEMNGCLSFIDDLVLVLSRYIETTDKTDYFNDTAANSVPGTQTVIKKEYNDRDGYYLSLTKKRADTLTKMLAKHAKGSIDVHGVTISVADLNIKSGGSSSATYKIYTPQIRNRSDRVVQIKEELKKLVKTHYKQLLNKWYVNYKTMFADIVKFICVVDFLKSGAKVAALHNYYKPQVVESEYGFIKCTKLRHPIIERINTSIEYVPHDITLGKTDSSAEEYIDDSEEEVAEPLMGMLLYGLNSGGKSTLMKSVGLAVILAQVGYFVPATTFIYSPYNSILTRICGNDNMYKGLSSFSVEMVELQAILRRCDKKSLVLADEIARGTETKSSNIIVLAMLQRLSDTETSFVSATHLHDIYNTARFKQLKNVRCFHLNVQYDAKNDVLVYTRHLKDGPGENFYGLTVAKFLIHDRAFIELTNSIKLELDSTIQIVGDKTSNYNKDIYMTACAVCNYKPKVGEIPLETHHIKEQKYADKNGTFTDTHIHKNNQSNLVVLCNSCHDMIDVPNKDNEKLVIEGYSDTSQGRILKYTKVKISPSVKTHNTKFDESTLKLVKSLGGEKGMTRKNARIIMKTKYSIEISESTISKIWKI
ncbi:MAG: DNA mismatch repair ATPase [Faunusvirus sp.]|jgi:DNA mismatch repair protein MutS|uniref:DNA mismatch repair ATPase n=1 Tax=Faunusvirus sp. TaxID=2487766 RepID=A0A3G5A017_9VIRU|nr:MAG: DNA mismatch repair ATPase [Faunusvirus sp.]